MKTYSIEEYLEARKVAIDAIPESNYLIIKLSYSCELVLKYTEGISLLATMEKAEQLSGDWDKKEIKPLDKENLSVTVISREDYINRKTAALLGVTYNEFLESTKEDKDD